MKGSLLAITAALQLAVANFGVEAQELKTATFAGGCFWCVESDFDHVPGVVRTVSGYTGGIMPNPTYKEVSSGGTRHREAVQIIYDPSQVSYTELLTYFGIRSILPIRVGSSAWSSRPATTSWTSCGACTSCEAPCTVRKRETWRPGRRSSS